jgi:hypothetical protein
VNEKKGRCFSPSAQKAGSNGFVHNKASNCGIKEASRVFFSVTSRRKKSF